MRARIITVAAIASGICASAQFPPQRPNAPFSAEMLTTRVQTLADGTHITQPEQTTKMFRDSLGRTRAEMSMPGPPGSQQPPVARNITIVDPVEGVRYFLNVDMKTAQKIVLPKPVQRPATAPQPIGTPSGAAIAAVGPNAMMLYPAQGGVAFAGRPYTGGGGTAPTSKSESLGTQTIEGLIAEGHRTTITFSEGTVGNDREFVSTMETWQSQELGMTVLSKNSDPRTGERTEKLINVSRTEPDASLFQVPSDYTIEEQQPVPSRIQSAVPAAPAK